MKAEKGWNGIVTVFEYEALKVELKQEKMRPKTRISTKNLASPSTLIAVFTN